MIELGVMRGHLLKRVFPFVLALITGAGLALLLLGGDCETHSSHVHRLLTRLRLRPDCAPARGVEVAQVLTIISSLRQTPELHVLSAMKMSEVLEFERAGGGYEAARVISPPGSQYTAAKVKGYRQGVLQLEFLFGADGAISEVAPPAKRHDCSLCLSGANVTQIDPRDPRWGGQVAAAKAAVSRIEFVPGTLGGRPVGMHGVAECVFRLE
jgi:hypothetical protein